MDTCQKWISGMRLGLLVGTDWDGRMTGCDWCRAFESNRGHFSHKLNEYWKCAEQNGRKKERKVVHRMDIYNGGVRRV